MNNYLYKELSLNSSKPKEVRSSYYLKLISKISLFFILRAYWLSLLPDLLSCACIQEFLRILRVTSLLFTVLADTEGRLYVLVIFLFIILTMVHSIKWEWESEGITYGLLLILGILIHHSSTGTGPISVPPPL